MGIPRILCSDLERVYSRLYIRVISLVRHAKNSEDDVAIICAIMIKHSHHHHHQHQLHHHLIDITSSLALPAASEQVDSADKLVCPAFIACNFILYCEYLATTSA